MYGVTVTVQADSEAEVMAWLERLRVHGLVQYGRPTDMLTGRWMVRARPGGPVRESTEA